MGAGGDPQHGGVGHYYETADAKYEALERGQVDVISSVSLSPLENTRIIRLNVLAAEDNSLNAEILQFMLEEAGANETLVADGQQEVEAFEKSPVSFYGLTLTDILMPVMNGDEASRRIRAMERADARTVPIIALSANAYAEDAQKSREAGINAPVGKPVNLQ